MDIRAMVRGVTSQQMNKIDNKNNEVNNKKQQKQDEEKNQVGNSIRNRANNFDGFEKSKKYESEIEDTKDIKDIKKIKVSELKTLVSEESILNGDYTLEEKEKLITIEQLQKATMEFNEKNIQPELLQNFEAKLTPEEAELYDLESLAGGFLMDEETFIRTTKEAELKMKEELAKELESRLITYELLDEHILISQELHELLENFTPTSENITRVSELMAELEYYKETYGINHHLIN